VRPPVFFWPDGNGTRTHPPPIITPTSHDDEERKRDAFYKKWSLGNNCAQRKVRTTEVKSCLVLCGTVLTISFAINCPVSQGFEDLVWWAVTGV
jgi:hypothetical protein